MQNSSQVTNYRKLLKNIIFTSLLISFAIYLISPVLSQTQLPLPDQFKFITTNSRALEKDLELTVSKDLNNISQSIALDRTGLILHLVPSPPIKDSNTRLKVVSDDGTELEIFTFTNGTLFTLIAPDKTYSIIQEITPDCDLIKSNFSLDDKTTTVCPDSIAYKIYSNIMILTDTSFKITLKTPIEFYSIPITLPESTEQTEKQSFIEVTNDSSINTQSTESTINVAGLLKTGELCLVSSVASSSGASNCSFSNSSINTITSYKKNLQSQEIFNNINLLSTFLANTFKTLQHEFIFIATDSTETSNKSTQITTDSQNKLFLDSYNYNLTLDLGKIKKGKTLLKKGVFILKNPFEINSLLKQFSLTVPINNLDGIINIFSNPKTESLLTSISITNNSVDSSIKNNVLIPNSFEPTPTPMPTPTPTPEELNTKPSKTAQSFQVQPTPTEENINIKIYLPNNTKDFIFSKTYTYIEQNTAPSVDEKGKAVEIINNKSKIDYIFSKEIDNFDQNNNKITVELEPLSNILKDKIFKNPVILTGFLIPPDFRPVLETGYRATFEINMIINLDDLNSVDLIYSDLKTKDETALTNFFEFDFVPQGIYNAIIKFDADRNKLFQDAGVLKKSNWIFDTATRIYAIKWLKN